MKSGPKRRKETVRELGKAFGRLLEKHMELMRKMSGIRFKYGKRRVVKEVLPESVGSHFYFKNGKKVVPKQYRYVVKGGVEFVRDKPLKMPTEAEIKEVEETGKALEKAWKKLRLKLIKEKNKSKYVKELLKGKTYYKRKF